MGQFLACSCDCNLFLSRLNDRNAFDRLENDAVALRNPQFMVMG